LNREVAFGLGPDTGDIVKIVGVGGTDDGMARGFWAPEGLIGRARQFNSVEAVFGNRAETADDGEVRAVDVRGNIEAAERMDLLGGFGNCPPTAHGKDSPLHFDDVIIPCDDRLVAEGLGVVDALWKCRVHPVGHRERLFNGVEERDGMDLFSRLHFHSVEAREAGATRTLGNRGRVSRRLMVGEGDTVHASGLGALDDFRGRHLKIRAGTQATMNVQIKLHTSIIANGRGIWYTNAIMNIDEIIRTLDGTLVAGGHSDRKVGSVVANDLMSDVLLNDGEDMLLLTSLASDQAVRTANIVGAMCVVVHNAKPLPQTMCQVADALGIPLVSSPLSKYDSCVRIHHFLENEEK